MLRGGATITLSYLRAKGRNIDFNISSIGKDYLGEDWKLFDPANMRGLYRYGFQREQEARFLGKAPARSRRITCETPDQFCPGLYWRGDAIRAISEPTVTRSPDYGS